MALGRGVALSGQKRIRGGIKARRADWADKKTAFRRPFKIACPWTIN